jgi:hypothetical protein
MRPLTIALLATAITALFLATLAHGGQVAIVARVVCCIAFVGSIVAYARGLPRTLEPRPSATRPGSQTPAHAHG